MLTLPTNRFVDKRNALLGAGAVVCIYSILVLFYALAIPEVGFRTAFDNTVRGFDGEFIPADHDHVFVPRPGDRLVSFSGRAIQTWPQFLRAVRELPLHDATVVLSLNDASKDETFVHFNGTVWVRTELERGDSIRFSGWSRVRSLPIIELVPSVLWFFLKLGLFAIAALVFWKRLADQSATRFYILGVVTLGAYMGGYHWSRIAGNPPLILVFMLCAVMLPAVLLHFYLVFPTPKPIFQLRPSWTKSVVYGVPLGFLVALVSSYFWVFQQTHGNATPEEVNRSLVFLLNEVYVYLAIAALWYLACVFCLIHSYRTARDSMEVNQVKWILLGSLAASIPIAFTLYLAAFERNAFGAGAATWPMFTASACFTVAFAIAITRYRLMHVDQILLARGRFKKALDRLDRTVQRMGQAIEQLVDPPTLARQLLQAAAEVLAVSRGAVYLREGNPPLYRLVESLGPTPPLSELSPGCPIIETLQRKNLLAASAARTTRVEPAQRQLHFLGGEVAHSLAHEGHLLALLVLGPKSLGAYSPEDLNLLAALCQLAALALKSAERHQTIESLNKDLQAKVEKISEQQRRILVLQSQLTRKASPPAAAPAPTQPPVGGIVGSSPVVQQLMHFVKKVSASQSAVLIRGESGTGKELLARALHESSPRAGKAFVKVHCAALSPGLLESELFGHVKGAFTGAHRDKAGRFQMADGGTLFLDEIGDINLDTQTKLLRVLQEKTFERVGSSDPLEVDVRVIAATHQNLEALIAEGRFREDLYYRLNVISVAVPPLRDRREDIPELAAHFLRVHSQRSGKAITQIDDDALAVLKAFQWPGNIRQLENVIERAVVVADGSCIGVGDLPTELAGGTDDHRDLLAESADGQAEDEIPQYAGIQHEREEHGRRERERLVRALAAAKGNKAEAARALGLARSTLVSRLKKYGLS
jgi:transcriptional regulator with GAF, ATPase, and Fis domain